jgi:hypothetical protein
MIREAKHASGFARIMTLNKLEYQIYASIVFIPYSIFQIYFFYSQDKENTRVVKDTYKNLFELYILVITILFLQLLTGIILLMNSKYI